MLFGLFVVAGLATAPWDEWAAGVIALLILCQMLVGAGDELVFRGFLLVGARARHSELGALLFTCVLFGLSHGANVLTGQALGPRSHRSPSPPPSARPSTYCAAPPACSRSRSSLTA